MPHPAAIIQLGKPAIPLKAFEYQHAGEIIFGNGRISEIGSVVGSVRSPLSHR